MPPRLYIGTPSYRGSVSVGYTRSLWDTGAMFWRMGITVLPKFVENGAVHIARNVLVANFMASGFSHLAFIDEDVIWRPEALGRLLAATEQFADIEVCCGVYPRKTTPISWPVNPIVDDGGPRLHSGSGFWELRDACAGFLVLKRAALEKMMAAYPERKMRIREDTPPDEEPFEYLLFDFFPDVDRRYLTEDHGFSRLWQRIGGRIWADPGIDLQHVGQHVYTGKLTDLLRG